MGEECVRLSERYRCGGDRKCDPNARQGHRHTDRQRCLGLAAVTLTVISTQRCGEPVSDLAPNIVRPKRRANATTAENQNQLSTSSLLQANSNSIGAAPKEKATTTARPPFLRRYSCTRPTAAMTIKTSRNSAAFLEARASRSPGSAGPSMPTAAVASSRNARTITSNAAAYGTAAG